MSKVGVVDAGAHHDQDAATAQLAEPALDGRRGDLSTPGPRARRGTTCGRVPRTGTPRDRRDRPSEGTPSRGQFASALVGSTTVMSVMPMDRRAATLSAPIGPAPNTITVSPGVTPDRVMPCMATDRGSASAAWRGDRPSGSRKTPAARARMYSANAPSECSVAMLLRFSHWDGFPSRQRRQVPQRGDGPPTTSSPTDHAVTSSPTAAMVPLHSWPATTPGAIPTRRAAGGCRSRRCRRRAPARRAGPGPGRGTDRSSTATTPGDW